MSFSNRMKGLLTEVASQVAGEDTLLDCQDMVISQEGKLESRHGANVQSIPDVYSFHTNSAVSVFKIPFSDDFATSSGYAGKYVSLVKSQIMQEMPYTTGLTTIGAINDSSIVSDYTTKPIGFTFDQSLYIIGQEGWQEMKIDALDSTDNKKIINWPTFRDISIETFQDTLDFSANWFDINKKVGIRLTYVWNTRYDDQTPREVESEPSQIYEVLHPMALRNQAGGTTVFKDQSRIRLTIGKTGTLAQYTFFAENIAAGRKFSIRVYRTKQVNINEALPTEYFQAFPDIEIGKTLFYGFSAGSVNTANDTIDFLSTTIANYWKNGQAVKFVGTMAPLIDNTIYYLGNKTGTTYQLFTTPLVSSNPINLTAAAAANLYRVYEANLTVNDDGIISLPQLYTNPNVDGEVNANAIPPVANSVVEYKNYHVAADIREPLRAYITLVNPPLVKNALFTHTIPTGTNGNYTFSNSTVDTTNGFDLNGLSQLFGAFKIDSVLFNQSGNYVGKVTGNSFMSTSDSRDLNIAGPLSSDAVLRFDATLSQQDAFIVFRLNGGSTVSAALYPEYNRSSPYSSTTDTNLEYLQYVGNRQMKTSAGNTVTLPAEVEQSGIIYPMNMTASINFGNERGQLGVANIIPGGVPTASYASGNYTIFAGATGKLNTEALTEPGIIQFSIAGSGGTFTYKTFEVTATNTIVFNDVSFSNDNIPTGNIAVTCKFIPGSTSNALPLYVSQTSMFRDNFQYINNTAIVADISAPGLVESKGFYSSEIGVTNGPIANGNILTNPFFRGTLARSPAQLLDLAVSKLVDRLNAASAGLAIKFVKTEEVGQFYVEYYGGTTLEARITGDNHAYEPEIIRSTTEWTKVAEYKQNNIRAVSISRYNAPESFPNQSLLAPILVGSDKKAIVALAKNANDCFILKEDGIWRLSISGNASLPFVDQVTQIDTTTYCQASYSVQEINEEIIFLSQKGFISISGNQIEAIGRQIETEVKTKLQRCLSKGLGSQIRSWVNEEKRVYGCTIPDTTSTFTTYIFNTYTREWTKFSLPIIDAVTDPEGKTLYCVRAYTRTLDATGTLQERVVNSSTGTSIRFILAEEIHTDGQNRNELDQYDYYYDPASAVDNGNGTVTFTDPASGSPWAKLGGTGTDITASGLAFFADRTPYYRRAGTLYPITFVSRTSTTVTVAFPEGIPAGITTIGSGDGIYAGVPSSATFNPTSVGTPDTNKQFSEYMIHVEEAVKSLSMKFKTDSQANFSAERLFTFNTVAVNRTVYRTHIPITAGRGRWFIRQVNHDVPMERLVMTGQTINVRDTSSSKIQKAPN